MVWHNKTLLAHPSGAETYTGDRLANITPCMRPKA